MNIEKYNNFLTKVLPSLNFIKKHLAIFLLIPVLVGGIIQLLELSSMSISFIRFFSSTQLLPDGLLVLFIIFICFIMYIVFQFMIALAKTIDGSKKIKYWHNKAIIESKQRIINFTDKQPKNFNHFKKHSSYHNIAIKELVIILGIFVLYISFLICVFIQKEMNIFSTLVLIFMILFFYKYIFGKDNPIYLLFWKINEAIKESNFKILIYKDYIVSILVILLIPIVMGLSIIAIKKIITHFNKQYMLPSNIKNFEKIQPQLEDKNYIFSEVTYFNDKYIFIKHSNNDKNITYEIVKLDKLF